MNSKKILGILGGISVVLTVLFGVWKIEDRYANAEDVGKHIAEQQLKIQNVEVRLDIKVLSDYRQELQERVWKLEDRYMVDGRWKPEAPPEVIEVHDKMVLDIAGLDERLQDLKHKAE